MLNTIRTYRNLRAKGLRRAWEISGMNEIGDRSVGIVCWIVVIAGALFLLSEQANALQESADNRAAAKVTAQAGEIEELRKIVAACLGDREGALFIGGELHLCRAVPTGIKQ